jgi:hypothetical protein
LCIYGMKENYNHKDRHKYYGMMVTLSAQ